MKVFTQVKNLVKKSGKHTTQEDLSTQIERMEYNLKLVGLL
jgi:hypothetical protein